jgi:hypothetical protein
MSTPTRKPAIRELSIFYELCVKCERCKAPLRVGSMLSASTRREPYCDRRFEFSEKSNHELIMG